MILSRLILLDVTPLYTRAKSLDETPFMGNDHGRMIPPRKRAIASPEAESLTETDQMAEEGVAMGQDKVTRLKVAPRCGLAWPKSPDRSLANDGSLKGLLWHV